MKGRFSGGLMALNDRLKAEYDNVHVILRACKSGKPEIQGNRITVEGKSYTTT
ncbi:MAG TPA: hypothetical protein IAB32_06945 [Candidatus Scatosoma pullicola]|nr:hypothetical protein [Candidatus Scatosoma pullicola]